MRVFEILVVLAISVTHGQDVADDARGLWTLDNVAYAGAGASLAVSAHSARDSWHRQLQGDWYIERPSDVTDVYGSGSFNLPLAFGLSTAGRLTHREGLQRLGSDLTRTLTLTHLVVAPMKVLAHRRRPDGSDHHSFPSGHTANTFAVARYLQREHGTRVALLPYAAAVTTAAGRLEGRRHYLSDVLMGATVGLIVGSSVDREADSHFQISAMDGGAGWVVSIAVN